MSKLAGRSSGSFDSKEKDLEVFSEIKEVVEETPPTSRLERFTEKFNAWLASRGLEGHGYVHAVYTL